jgi:hypothetical protein
VVASAGFAAFGVVVAVFPFAPLFAMRNAAIAEVFFGGRWTVEGLAYHAFSSGPLGGTIAGFYVLQAFIAAIPFKRMERWAWHAILWGTVLWFVVDSAVSIRHGAAFNVYMVKHRAHHRLRHPAGGDVPHVLRYRAAARGPARRPVTAVTQLGSVPGVSI